MEDSVDESLRVPTRVEIHTHTTDCVNLQEFRTFLTEKGLTVGVFQTQTERLEYFEIEYYNSEDTLIDVLCCPYGKAMEVSNASSVE